IIYSNQKKTAENDASRANNDEDSKSKKVNDKNKMTIVKRNENEDLDQ
ncbi:23922_t:CDS:1, partial [Dentiscutata erythropus]